MEKIKTIKHNKIWGFEIWLHSPLRGMETFLENGNPVTTNLLVKIIKADLPLSLQVHPDDKWAKELENEPNGKTESWYVLKTAQDSKLVMGLKTYDHDIILNKLKEETFEDIILKVIPEVGSFYNIPAGLVHGIGKNMTILEVQQPSDTTYRYYDYNRTDSEGNLRPLHIEKALKVQKDLNYDLRPINLQPLTYKNEIATQEFHSKPSMLKQDAIVVNLDNYDAYLATKNEQIDFNHYAVIYV